MFWSVLKRDRTAGRRHLRRRSRKFI